jgi:BMFP domain-containing protein YqiC
MSGRKRTHYELSQEQRLRHEVIRDIEHLRNVVSQRGSSIRSIFQNTSEGLRKTFDHAFEEAQRWLSTLDDVLEDDLDIHAEVDLLTRMRENLHRLLSEGNRIQTNLHTATTQRRDEISRQCYEHLTQAEDVYAQYQPVLKRWCDPLQVQQWRHRLDQIHSAYRNEEYSKVNDLLPGLVKEIAERGEQAERKEQQHQKRLYLLSALREVCKQLGFEEVQPPRYENDSDRSSRILYDVDTIDKGTIHFVISMDLVETESAMSSPQCFDEFDTLSHELLGKFGIQTCFATETGETSPRLKSKNERDIPDSDSSPQTTGYRESAG